MSRTRTRDYCRILKAVRTPIWSIGSTCRHHARRSGPTRQRHVGALRRDEFDNLGAGRGDCSVVAQGSEGKALGPVSPSGFEDPDRIAVYMRDDEEINEAERRVVPDRSGVIRCGQWLHARSSERGACGDADEAESALAHRRTDLVEKP